MSEQTVSDVIPHLQEEVRSSLLQEMTTIRLQTVADQMEAQDLAEALEELPEELVDSIVNSLDSSNLERLNAVLDFPEDSAGRLMTTDVLSVPPDVRLAVILRWLRKKESLPPYTTSLMVTDDDGIYVGELPLSTVAVSYTHLTLPTILRV